MSFPIVRTGTVAFIVSGRPQRRSAVSTLVRLILNQTPLRGLRDMPGARARPRRHGRDVYDDLSSTTAAPGCPRLPQAAPTYPKSRRVAFLAPRDLYMEATRLGRGVADLGRTYAGSAGAPRLEAPGLRRTHTSANPRRRRVAINRPNLKRRGGGGHVIYQSRPLDRGLFSNSSWRAAAAGLSGDRLCRCRRRASGVFGSDLARNALARRLRSVRSDFISSKSTNRKKRARFVVL